ncbi:hypothetical protein [Kaistia terrae]|uniref:Uncharacterized protein n=1 Tax=Kaistia terrae TaxID=537017 RepID=A0ABW0Q2M2_9HYPH|nr:hypothetical protein [Kaistia terrae]MCX5581780.1 hypothetical protein [Kaistia terrae]
MLKIHDSLDFGACLQPVPELSSRDSAAAIQKGFLTIGVKEYPILVFSKSMDAATVYFIGALVLTNDPIVLQIPPGALGTIDGA